MKYILYLSIVCLSVVACTAPPNPDMNFYDLSNEQVQMLQDYAIEGDGACALRLGKYYSISKGDKSEALRWYKISADDGNSRGMYEYSLMLIENGTPKDNEEARKWLIKSRDNEPMAVIQLLRMNNS